MTGKVIRRATCVAADAQMQLHLATLSIVSVFVTTLAGILLLFSWVQNRDIRALAWWGASLLAGSAASVLLFGRASLPGWLSIGAANALLFVAYGLFWGGFRVFERRPAPIAAVLAGAVLWLAACGVPDIYKSFIARVVLASLVSGAYSLGAAWEIWRARGEKLLSRYPVFGLLLLHAAMILSRVPTLNAWGATGDATVFTTAWVAFHSFEALLFTVTSAFLLLGMTKERIECEQRAIAARDPLTGLPNRRSFFDQARKVLDSARRDGRSCALLLADLDHFKHVNDRFGHGAGDDVLRGFTRVMARTLPPEALLARLGGEEFACILPGAGHEEAASAAERLRTEFAGTRFEADREAFSATVSVGLATSGEFGHILDALMPAADMALYMAKGQGRNCVASLPLPEAGPAGSSAGEALPLAA